jgi:hypothetical protein
VLVRYKLQDVKFRRFSGMEGKVGKPINQSNGPSKSLGRALLA